MHRAIVINCLAIREPQNEGAGGEEVAVGTAVGQPSKAASNAKHASTQHVVANDASGVTIYFSIFFCPLIYYCLHKQSSDFDC